MGLSYQTLKCFLLLSATGTSPLGPSGWMCSHDFIGTCDLNATLSNTTRWIILGGDGPDVLVDHCLASKIPQVCDLQYNLFIIIIITVGTFVKLVAIILTLRTVKGPHLITIGDAIASYLTEKDPATADLCLISKAAYREINSIRGTQSYQDEGLGRQFGRDSQCFTFQQTRARPVRWNSAPFVTRWIVCVFL